MAADLRENFQYGLSSSGLSGADKTVLLLKLTDPSLKCIEQYQKLKYSSSKRPSIQFKGNSGVITFPSREAKDGEREFKFTVQPLQAPRTSSFESIQHYCNSRGEHKLDSLGSIQTKVTVSGTDDVYQTTQKKMKLADEEMKKVSTKEVKQNQFKPGHRVKRKSISAHAKKIMSSSSAASSQSSTNLSSVSSNSTSYSSTSATSFNASSATTTLLSSATSAARGSNSASMTTSSKSAISGSGSSSSGSIKNSSTKTSGTSSKPSGGTSASQKSAVHNRSCRDRVIHLLALRPYKRLEIFLRLQKDGISSKEKNQLAIILPQVATLARDNSYVLNKNLYNEVSLDWPAYSETDKQLLKRKRAELCLKDSPSPPSQRSPHHIVTNSSSSSAPTASSASASAATGSPSTQAAPRPGLAHRKPLDAGSKAAAPSSQKRPLLPEEKDYKQKKPRIAHNLSATTKPSLDQPQLSPSSGLGSHKKAPSPVGLFKKVPSPSSTTSHTPHATTTTVSSSPSSNPAQQSALSSPSVSTTRNSPDCCDSTAGAASLSLTTTTTSSAATAFGGGVSKSLTNGCKDGAAGAGKGEKQGKGSSDRSVKEEKRPVGKESPSGDVSSTSAVPDFALKYSLITSIEQRHRYKEEFNKLYPQYHDYHRFIEGIKQKFKQMQDELYNTPQDSKQYIRLQDKVIQEYSKITQDPDYKVKEKRWKELHDLLGHIKSLITAYDKERLQIDNS